uniref:Uncharacterized protein n=1 Tax=Arundo donax TaxID=35708 RepID=A0A0A9ETH8_ARUDO
MLPVYQPQFFSIPRIDLGNKLLTSFFRNKLLTFLMD